MRLAVVNYDYPRPGAPGANRWAMMTKYLRRLGHDVTVIAPVAAGMSPGESDGVLRTTDLNSAAALRKLLRRSPAEAPSKAPSAVSSGTTVLLERVIVPDMYLLSWLPWAWRALQRVLHDRPVDCLITSGPPQSSHLLGLAYSRTGPPWIADFRDGWTFEPPHAQFPTAPQRALAAAFERRVVTRADGVVGVTQPIVEDLRARLGAAAELISNGWDPELLSAASARPEPIDAARFTFVHTGMVTGGSGRDPRPLLAALRLLLDADPGLANRVEVLFVGSATVEDLAMLGGSGLGGCVRYGGRVERSEALALQRAAGALLLLTSSRSSEATGKIFEYLGSGRPIIALAERNEAARIIEQTGTGVCVAPGDLNAIAAALRRAIDGELERSYAPRNLERYTYPAPAQLMAKLAARVSSSRFR